MLKDFETKSLHKQGKNVPFNNSPAKNNVNSKNIVITLLFVVF